MINFFLYARIFFHELYISTCGVLQRTGRRRKLGRSSGRRQDQLWVYLAIVYLVLGLGKGEGYGEVQAFNNLGIVDFVRSSTPDPIAIEVST